MGSIIKNDGTIRPRKSLMIAIFSCFDTIHECDRRTDRQTPPSAITALTHSVAHRAVKINTVELPVIRSESIAMSSVAVLAKYSDAINHDQLDADGQPQITHIQ